MRELFQEMGAHLDVYDHTTFERAVLALIEKEGTAEQKKTYEDIVKSTSCRGTKPLYRVFRRGFTTHILGLLQFVMR